MSNIDEVVRIVYMQSSQSEEFQVLNALANNKEHLLCNMLLGYLYGVMRGKQMERARRKGRSYIYGS